MSKECLSWTQTMCNHFLFYTWEISLQNYSSNTDCTLCLPQPMLNAELPFTPVKTKAQKFAAAEVFSDLIVFSPVGPSGDQWKVTLTAKYVNSVNREPTEGIWSTVCYPGTVLRGVVMDLIMNLYHFMVQLWCTKLCCTSVVGCVLLYPLAVNSDCTLKHFYVSIISCISCLLQVVKLLTFKLFYPD